jgi:acetyl esterase/lipase
VFPTQLHQLINAVTILFEAGLRPENLQLCGDSAGGNLILQLFSHTLHRFPDPSFPQSPLTPVLEGKMKAIRGAYLMSPWLNLNAVGGSFEENSHKDILPRKTYQDWGRIVLSPIPREHHNYIDSHTTPPAWFDGISTLVDRILVTAGDSECMRTDIVTLANEILGKHHDNVKLIVQENGVHIEPIFGFTGKNGKGEITATLVQWFKEGFLEV